MKLCSRRVYGGQHQLLGIGGEGGDVEYDILFILMNLCLCLQKVEPFSLLPADLMKQLTDAMGAQIHTRFMIGTFQASAFYPYDVDFDEQGRI